MPLWIVWYLQTLGNLSFLLCFFLCCGKLCCCGKVKLGGKRSAVYWECVAVVLHLGLCLVGRSRLTESGWGWSQGHPACLSPSGFKENSSLQNAGSPSAAEQKVVEPVSGSMCKRVHCMKKEEWRYWSGSTLNTFLLVSVTGKQNNWLVGLCLYVCALKAINSSRNQFEAKGRRIEGDENTWCLTSFTKQSHTSRCFW